MLNIFRFVLLLSVVVWVGGLIFFTFFVAPSIFKVLPRELAGELVSNIFPKYWALGYVAGLLSLASLLAISRVEELKSEFRAVHMKSYAVNMAVIVSGVVFVFFAARSSRL
jgi:uncharacterized membrane protein